MDESEPLAGEEGSDRQAAEDLAARPWQAYLEASLGFRNHWYPALFGYELDEGECRASELLGEPILFKRIAGTVYAIRDRCAHRGVRFSLRPECYTENTITCWYHGFTYSMKDGRLVAIVTDPESSLIGKVRLRTYPVEERKGLIFVFIGDLDPPPPLLEDVQPGLLDADLVLTPRGERQVVRSNWRLGAENGFDAAHIYIHRNSALITALRATLPLSTIPSSREGMVIAEDGAPKGVIKGAGKRAAIWEAEIEGVKVSARFRPVQEGVTPLMPDTSIWLPCGLKVDPFPIAGMIQFEWYVPIDERSHMYIVTWGKRVRVEAEALQFYAEVELVWKDMVVSKFNADDVAAREGMDRFYAEDDGWHRERLFRPDMVITEWRKLASLHNRGIQRRGGGARLRKREDRQ